MTDFPHGTIAIHTTTLYQADCERCGWHTRQADSKPWVEQMARQHFEVCSNPSYRNGALMECGCWYYANLGDEAGKTKAVCPLHGETLMVKANVAESVAYGLGFWRTAEDDRCFDALREGKGGE